MKNPISSIIMKFAGRLRFPYLFVATGLLFIINIFVPDPFPFADELILGLVTLLLGNIRDRRKNPPKDNEPPTAKEGRLPSP